MSALGMAAAPIERVAADLAVVALFEDERPLLGAAGRIDWRLCGRLSHLFAAGRLRGESGAAVLIPGGGGVRALRVLGLGAGARSALDAEGWKHWVDDALARARGLRAGTLVLGLPASEGAPAARLDALAKVLSADSGHFEVLLASEPEDTSAVVEWLRAASRRARSGGIVVHAPGDPPPPQGAGTPSRGTESSQASAGRFTR